MPRKKRGTLTATTTVSEAILPHTMIEILRANPIGEVLYAFGHPVVAYEKGWSFQHWHVTIAPGNTAFTLQPDQFKKPMHVFCIPAPNSPEMRARQQALLAAIEGEVFMLLKGQYMEER